MKLPDPESRPPGKPGGATPMIHQYLRIKERHQDAIVFFRMGDFYEMFFEDAVVASRELGIALTTRSKQNQNEEEIPFCGVPWHSSSSYASRLLARGFKVVICEQTEQPSARAGRALLKREAVRILTPGLAVEEDLLGSGENRYLFAVYPEGDRFGISKLDFTTGDFKAAEAADVREVISEVLRTKPPELLVRKTRDQALLNSLREVTRGWLAHPANLVVIEWDPSEEADGPRVSSAGSLTPLQARAAGFALHYLRQNHFNVPPHIGPPEPFSLPSFLRLDDSTLRNLEIISNSRDHGYRNTLWETVNFTVTPMGKRRLMEWLLYPLLDAAAIERRLDAVEEALKHEERRKGLRLLLRGLSDIERLNARNSLGQSLPREIIALRDTLRKLPEVLERIGGFQAAFFRDLAAGFDTANDLATHLAKIMVDQPPPTARDGGVFRPGTHAELDDLRGAVENGQKWLLQLEKSEREKTGIPLKIKYHPVFGYLLEVTRSHLGRVPDHYHRKQTLAGAERFKVDELVQMENKILGAEEKARALEQKLFDELRALLAGQSGRLKKISEALASVDALLSLAELARGGKYVRPKLTDRPVLSIKGGRHPVLDRLMTREPFIENDLMLGGDDPFLMMITGPNMAGKSTYMRQAALIVILAQIGSFVPAEEAVIGLTDRIFTRIGASDDLAGGRSTFMVEMEEIADILAHATERSLVVVDEIGRGTGTYDGVAIAWAVAEYLLDRVRARTLYATHYHELIRLGEERTGARNVHVSVKEWSDKIIFLHKVRDGGTSKSYGVQVAKLAGVPAEVISRAQTMLFAYEQNRSRAVEPQYDLFGRDSAQGPAGPSDIEAELKKFDMDTISPMEAFQILSGLVAKVKP